MPTTRFSFNLVAASNGETVVISEPMAKITQSIVDAPHALELSFADVHTVEPMIHAGILRQHRSKHMHYWTNPSDRSGVESMLQAFANWNYDQQHTGTEGVFITDDGVELTQEDTNLLRTINDNPTAYFISASLEDSKVRLIEADLIQEHSRKPGYFFTVAHRRDYINDIFATVEAYSWHGEVWEDEDESDEEQDDFMTIRHAENDDECPLTMRSLAMLASIRKAPHAIGVDEMHEYDEATLTNLVDSGVVIAPRRQPGKFYISKNWRASLDECIAHNTVTDTPVPAPVVEPPAPCAEPEPTTIQVPAYMTLTEDMMDVIVRKVIEKIIARLS